MQGPKYPTAQYRKLPSNGGLTWINQQDPSITFRKSRNREGLCLELILEAWNLRLEAMPGLHRFVDAEAGGLHTILRMAVNVASQLRK